MNLSTEEVVVVGVDQVMAYTVLYPPGHSSKACSGRGHQEISVRSQTVLCKPVSQ